MKAVIPALCISLYGLVAGNPACAAEPAAVVAAPACAEAATAQRAGFDAARLCALLSDFGASKNNFHGLVIERHGVVVAQAYRSGKDKPIYAVFSRNTDFNATTRHDVRSISKSVTSLLWGIARGQNLTPPLTTPVLELMPELAELKQQGREAVTLGHLLTMSSGLQWNEPALRPFQGSNDEFGLYWHASQAGYLFDRPMAAPAGTRFNYNGGGTAVLAQILADHAGMELPDFARQYLFEPLGITDWEWKGDLRGRPLAFAGLRLRPLDLARIGQLVLQHGQWEGKQIVPADWIAESTRPQIDTGDGLQYGYQWWLGKVDALGGAHDWSGGMGNGGQRLYIVPDLDLVVAITAGDYGEIEIGRQGRAVFDRIAGALRE